MLKNRKLFKDFVSGVREHRYTTHEVREKLKELPIKVLRRIGKKIIYTDYDDYNYSIYDDYNYLIKSCKLAYFDNLDRWQKEFFIEQRLYKLYV